MYTNHPPSLHHLKCAMDGDTDGDTDPHHPDDDFEQDGGEEFIIHNAQESQSDRDSDSEDSSECLSADDDDDDDDDFLTSSWVPDWRKVEGEPVDCGATIDEAGVNYKVEPLQHSTRVVFETDVDKRRIMLS